MQKNILLLIITIVFLIPVLFTGCSGTGIAKELYDSLNATLQETQNEAQAKIGEAQKKIDDLQAEKAAKERELQAKIAELQNQVSAVKEQASLVGSSTEDTAKRIVKTYKETHTYSKIDMFTCSDFSSEVWNMLKTQGINAFIAIGSIKTGVTDILQSDHAWVMAEISPGKYLALETTAGVAIPKAQNAFYYRGWKFASPQAIKDNNDMIKKYNTLVKVRNDIAAEDREIVQQHSKATNPADAEKLEAVHNKLIELIELQETELNRMKAEIDSLATPFSV